MLPWHSLVLYCGIYAVAIAVPGPGMFSIMARALGSGFRSTIPAVMGNTLGDLALMTLSALGLAMVAREFGAVFHAVKIAGALYLIHLGYRYWTAPVADGMMTPARHGFWSQFALTLGNPKAIVMFVALLPSAVDLNRLTGAGYLQLCLCTLILIPVIGFAYAALAARARAFLTGMTARRRLNKSAGIVMMGAGIGVMVN